MIIEEIECYYTLQDVSKSSEKFRDSRESNIGTQIGLSYLIEAFQY